MNPRYLAYVRSHGRTVDEMSAADEEDWPGGRACGFILWMSQRWQQWAKLRGYKRTASGSDDTYIDDAKMADFDAWLLTFADTEAEAHPEPRSSKITTAPAIA